MNFEFDCSFCEFSFRRASVLCWVELGFGVVVVWAADLQLHFYDLISETLLDSVLCFVF